MSAPMRCVRCRPFVSVAHYRPERSSMPERKPIKKVSPRNTKEELVSAYQELAKQLDERQSRAQEKAEEKTTQEAVAVADSFSTGEIARQAGGLKAEVGKLLADLSDRMEEEIN